jgi:hypothetical protein
MHNIPANKLIPGASYTFQVGPINVHTHGPRSPESTPVVPVNVLTRNNSGDNDDSDSEDEAMQNHLHQHQAGQATPKRLQTMMAQSL